MQGEHGETIAEEAIDALDAVELDAEVGYKKLVTVLGGEVGGVADERGDGRDQVADQPIRALAEPPPDLSATDTADVPASERQLVDLR